MNTIKKLSFFSLMFALVLFAMACGENSEAEQLEEDIEIIKQYLADNNLSGTETGSGLHYVVEDPGVGEFNPNINSTVTVAYTGYYTDGVVFDSNDNATFSLTNVIPGWQEGIPLFKREGKGKLLIPSVLGYGPEGNDNIPENAVLIFDIELKNF